MGGDTKDRSRMLVAYAAALLVMAAPFASSCALRHSEKQNASHSALECNGLRIRATSEVFGTALELRYRIDGDEASFCYPRGMDLSEADVFAVELRRADDADSGLVQLPRELRFEAIPRRPHQAVPVGPVQVLAVASGGPPLFDVPSGMYRLALKYRPKPCSRKLRSRACVSLSEPIRIRARVTFAVED